MDYQELHQRYGSHIAKRVRAELSDSEFNQVNLDNLAFYLKTRAEKAQKEYQVRFDDPVGKQDEGARDAIDGLHLRWRDAEELAYLVTVAEDVSLTVRARLKAG